LREFLRKRYSVAALLVAILTLSPSVASAQPAPPHLFIGSATIDGNPAADGTVVAALVDGQQVVVEPVSGDSYTKMVELKTGSFFGKTVTFMIGGIPAKQTALWVEGWATTRFDCDPDPTDACASCNNCSYRNSGLGSRRKR